MCMLLYITFGKLLVSKLHYVDVHLSELFCVHTTKVKGRNEEPWLSRNGPCYLDKKATFSPSELKPNI